MYKLLLCVRYLRTKYIALACIISVMLGVATMIVVNSVMAGFATEMRDRLHNFLADIVIESRSMDGIANSKAQMEVVRNAVGDYVEAMTPTVEIPGMITFTDPFSGAPITTLVQIHGIDPEGKALVGPLAGYLDSYNAIIEEGQVIRPPLRSADEPLGWELTTEAAAYREMILREKQQFLPQQSTIPAASTPAATAPTFDETGAPGAIAGAEGTSTLPNIPPDQFAEDVPEDPFGAQMPEGLESPDNGPLRARLYLGEGIVSFQVRDPDTGRMEKMMMVNPGDDVILSTMTSGRPPEVVKFSATVVDTFRSGMNEFDTSIVLMNIDELQRNRGMIAEGVDHITSIHIRLKNYDDAKEVVSRLKAAFPPGQVNIRTWEDKQGLLLAAVEVETAILNVLLFMIIAVAGFGILAIFYMIVVEKTRDIGILKSLGASSTGVMSIFLSYGLGLGIVGSSAGVGLGLLFVTYINEIEDILSWITGRKVFDEKIYYFMEIPTRVSPWMVFFVAAGAISIAVLASVLPALRASRLHPVRALRYE
ncbi:MAG: FtsX-like permease family protein [Planctomyces sp.]|nr:FtsX-like permease family protein [Planctomyces sp.]